MIRWLWCAAILLLAGCHPARVLIASPGDYADYRRVRVAEDIDARMAATWAYLEARPDGQYSERLRRYFDKAEPVYYEVRRRSIKGLEAYLRAMPDGPHAKQALDELVASRDTARREELLTRQVRQSQRRLDYDRQKRAEAAELLLWWLSALLDDALWRAPIDQAPDAFLVRYRLSLPRPECQPHADNPDIQLCFKSVSRGFRVSGRDGLTDRTIAFDLEIDLDARWHIFKATLVGDALFVGTLEAQQQRALDADDAEVRRRAADAVINQLTEAMAVRKVACNGGSTPDGHTVLDCGRLRITFEPGQDGDDVIYVEPVPAETPADAAPVEQDAADPE